MVADLLRKLAQNLRKQGAAPNKQALKGIDNPGAAGASGIPNPTSSYVDGPADPSVGGSPEKMKGWTPKIPTTWRTL